LTPAVFSEAWRGVLLRARNAGQIPAARRVRLRRVVVLHEHDEFRYSHEIWSGCRQRRRVDRMWRDFPIVKQFDRMPGEAPVSAAAPTSATSAEGTARWPDLRGA